MPRVLYVDDEAHIREIATLSLSLDPELEIRSCASGAEALAAIDGWRPDLILLDVMMPGMDGPTTLAKLRENPASVAIPVVFITARTQTRERERFLALGAAGIIAKPFDPMQLAQTAKGFLQPAS
jgi:two-component system OmpR family response regulator